MLDLIHDGNFSIELVNRVDELQKTGIKEKNIVKNEIKRVKRIRIGDGKKVILFNTFNSRFKDDEFAVFKQKIQGRGGAVIDHIYVRRGRVYNQMSNVELFTEIKNLLDKKLLNYY